MRHFSLMLVLFLLTACAQPETEPFAPTPLALAATSTTGATSTVEAAATTTLAPPLVESKTAVPAPSRTVAPSSSATFTPTPSPTNTAAPSATETATPLPSATATLLPTATPLPPSPTLAPPTPVPPTVVPPTTVAAAVGQVCLRPPDNYQRVAVGRHTVSARTAAMLDNAQALYGGRGSMRLLIQGSYATGLDASFGTHDGGGAVDVWAVDPNNTDVLLDDVPQMVTALRQAGFAAWYRPANMLYQGMFPHIHAIAVGDAELSASAIAQLTGEQGYFRGRNGLPQPEFAGPDPHGEAILCGWMEEIGYSTGPTETVAACQPPLNDYARVTVNGWTLNRRTHVMLQTAQALYGGPGDLLWVTQGSYNPGTAASFGTHDSGGVVDLSIRHPNTGALLVEETDRMVLALRQAGFAAWYRAPGDLGPDSAPHIHAVAVGDAELSQAAAAQLTGEQGYFRGRNALPQPELAAPDRHGGPIVCAWMEALGYADLR